VHDQETSFDEEAITRAGLQSHRKKINACVSLCVCARLRVQGPVICPTMKLRISTTEMTKLFKRCPVLIDHFRKNIRNTTCNYMYRTTQCRPCRDSGGHSSASQREGLFSIRDQCYVVCVMNKVSVSFHQGPIFIIHPLSAIYQRIN
jgi:hypothetical protein